MIVWNKFLKMLNEKGISTYEIKGKSLLSQNTLAKIKMCSGSVEEIKIKLQNYKDSHNGKEFATGVSTTTIEELCQLMECQPTDLFEWVVELDKTKSYDYRYKDKPIDKNKLYIK
ncbi:MAG: helix-turn-helix transcriptional regulator [Ruminococcus sp.]|nr:helix-turn-helix transcriptional regulator [Ruminococcus sp.]